MEQIKELRSDENDALFDRTNMFFKEFELPTEPKFNDLTVSILDFGAKADNETDS